MATRTQAKDVKDDDSATVVEEEILSPAAQQAARERAGIHHGASQPQQPRPFAGRGASYGPSLAEQIHQRMMDDAIRREFFAETAARHAHGPFSHGMFDDGFLDMMGGDSDFSADEEEEFARMRGTPGFSYVRPGGHGDGLPRYGPKVFRLRRQRQNSNERPDITYEMPPPPEPGRRRPFMTRRRSTSPPPEYRSRSHGPPFNSQEANMPRMYPQQSTPYPNISHARSTPNMAPPMQPRAQSHSHPHPHPYAPRPSPAATYVPPPVPEPPVMAAPTQMHPPPAYSRNSSHTHPNTTTAPPRPAPIPPTQHRQHSHHAHHHHHHHHHPQPEPQASQPKKRKPWDRISVSLANRDELKGMFNSSSRPQEDSKYNKRRSFFRSQGDHHHGTIG